MSGRIFLDTNILIYAYSHTDIAKRDIARDLIRLHNSVVSIQVLQELSNTLSRKFSQPWQPIQIVLEETIQNNELYRNTEQTVLSACRLADRYGYSFYDSLILAAALESQCAIVMSEDMQHEQLIEGRLRIVNPFSEMVR